MHLAAKQGQLDIAKMLIKEYNADINSLNKVYGTPLHCAARDGQPRVLSYLLMENANVDLLTENKQTVMDVSTDERITRILMFISIKSINSFNVIFS